MADATGPLARAALFVCAPPIGWGQQYPRRRVRPYGWLEIVSRSPPPPCPSAKSSRTLNPWSVAHCWNSKKTSWSGFGDPAIDEPACPGARRIESSRSDGGALPWSIAEMMSCFHVSNCSRTACFRRRSTSSAAARYLAARWSCCVAAAASIRFSLSPSRSILATSCVKPRAKINPRATPVLVKICAHSCAIMAPRLPPELDGEEGNSA